MELLIERINVNDQQREVVSAVLKGFPRVPTAAKYPLPCSRFYKNRFLKLLIGSQPIIEGSSLICGKRVNISSI